MRARDTMTFDAAPAIFTKSRVYVERDMRLRVKTRARFIFYDDAFIAIRGALRCLFAFPFSGDAVYSSRRHLPDLCLSMRRYERAMRLPRLCSF